MQRRVRLLALLVLLGLTLLTFPGAALGKSYTINRAVLEATLLPDGSLAVTESRTYQFDGSFSRIYQIIRMPGRSTLQEISLADEQGPMRQASTGEPGTFSVGQNGTDWQVDGFFRAENTTRTFTLTYRIADAIRMHEDGAELYWNLIGSEWAVPTALAMITLNLPGEPVDAWAEGPGQTEYLNARQIRYATYDLPPGSAMTLRVLLPREAVPQSALPPDGETGQAVRARAGRVPDPRSEAIQAVWLMVALGGGIWFYRRWVRRNRTVAPPEALVPLPLAALARFTQNRPIDGFRATLLDLVNRGVISVQQDGTGFWVFTRNEAAGLAPYEAEALEMLFPYGRTVATTAEWQGGGDSVRYNHLMGWWGRVNTMVPADWRQSHRGHMYLLALVGLTVTTLTNPSPLRLVSGLACIPLVILGLAQARFSDEGYAQFQGWQAVRRNWNASADLAYLPMAVALGLNVLEAFDPTATFQEQWQWMGHTFHYMDSYWDRPMDYYSGGGGGDSGGGGGGDGGGGGGAE